MLIPPRKEHRFVHALCHRLVAGSKPVRVPIIPRDGSEFNNCFCEVQKTIGENGGTLEHGWCIWERPGLFIEGEFHGIWVSPTGERVDVTPKRAQHSGILFLPDSEETFDEKSLTLRDNVRMAMLNHPIVHEFIKHCEAFATFRDEATDPNDPRVFRADERKYNWFVDRMLQLEQSMIALPVGRNDLCRCGSAEKFKKCCGLR